MKTGFRRTAVSFEKCEYRLVVRGGQKACVVARELEGGSARRIKVRKDNQAIRERGLQLTSALLHSVCGYWLSLGFWITVIVSGGRNVVIELRVWTNGRLGGCVPRQPLNVKVTLQKWDRQLRSRAEQGYLGSRPTFTVDLPALSEWRVVPLLVRLCI